MLRWVKDYLKQAEIENRSVLYRLFQTEFADNNFKFDKIAESSPNISRRLENTVGKGEIAL